MGNQLKREDVEFLENLYEKTKEFIGKKITIHVGGKERNNYSTQICVSGILEEHPESPGHFRVVDPSDDGTYTYFKSSDLRRIVSHESYHYKNGALGIIQIEVNTSYI